VSPENAQNIILWDPDTVASWWWLVERAPYTTTPFRMVHDLGIAMAWLGLCLLITRSRLARQALGPLAAAGAMTLTLYTAHVIVLEATSFLEDHPIQLFLVLAYIALSFAALWRQDGRQGPLEAHVTWASAHSRHMVESYSRTNRINNQRPHPPLEKATAAASGAQRRNSTTARDLGVTSLPGNGRTRSVRLWRGPAGRRPGEPVPLPHDEVFPAG
jgi:hypothetical protein